MESQLKNFKVSEKVKDRSLKEKKTSKTTVKRNKENLFKRKNRF